MSIPCQTASGSGVSPDLVPVHVAALEVAARHSASQLDLPCSTRWFFTVTMSPSQFRSHFYHSQSVSHTTGPTWLHLQSDVILRVVHDVIESPHGLVELLDIVNITVEVRISAKVRPVDAIEFSPMVVTTIKRQIIIRRVQVGASHMRKGFCVILSYWM